MTDTATPTPRSRRLRWLGVAAAAVAAYALLGFLLAPRLLRSAIEEKGSVALRRPVTVREVKVNPFTLSVTVTGLEVKMLAGWESLYVRLAPWKVLRRDLGVAEIRLVRPYGRLALDAQGRLNVQDLLDGEPAPAGAPPPEEKISTLGVALDRLEIEEARLVFVDGQREPAFETTLGPLTVRLRDFRTRGGADSPYSVSGSTESGETFSWTGTVLSEPLRSSGSISFAGVKLPKYQPYLSEALPGMLLASGTVSLEARYRAEWGAQARVLAISGLGVKVEGLELARARDRLTALKLPRLELRGGEIDLVGRAARVAELEVSGGQVALRREQSGQLALLEMLERRAPAGATSPAPQPAQRPASTAAPEPPFRWRLEKLALSGLGLELVDLAAPRPVQLALSEVAVQLTGLSEAPDTACPLTASLRWAGGGTASARGTVWPFRSRTELALEAQALDLAPLGPYLEGGAMPLRLASARLGLSLRTSFDGAGQSPAYGVTGDVRLEGLSLRQARGEELLAWRSLELLGIDVSSASRRAALRTVRLVEPRARAVIFEDGSSGLGAPPPADPRPPAAAAAPPAETRPAPAGPAWRVSVGQVELRRGAASFVDRSVQPPVLLALAEIEGRIADLSSDPRVRSRVELKAKAPGSAPVSVTGTLNPLQASAFTELAVVAKGVDLSPLDPYAAKHLGYGLRKGKLDVDVATRVEAGALAAANVARLDQLTLGEPSHSPDATSLPVRLALALLQDRDGLILLDVPVEGRLDDPELRLGRVIWRTVLNVLTKVATSPFSALAAIAGGGKEDLSAVEFAPGGAELDEPARQRVALLARALAQRPGVSLELEGTTDPVADATALRRAALEAQLRQAKPALAEGAPLPPEERSRRVEAAFRAAFPPKPPPAGAPAEPPPTPAAMEERLLSQVPVAPEALVALGAARTGAAREALLAAGVEAARLFATEGGERARKEQGARTWFTVR